ncbi:MAG TPA: DEAD/DEAH box helicase [Sedimentisphaerales bacterium]|nr:DEAD/DEAH box helicase [Sedimentisphaerales bacterium]
MKLYPFQEDGVSWLNGNRRALLADEMGLGKTVQAICAAETPTLVVCPASLKTNWAREIVRWRAGAPRVAVLSSSSGWTQAAKDADWLVVNYDILHRFEEQIRAEPGHYRTVIADEAHYIKNPGAARTKQFLGRGRRSGRPLPRLSAERMIALTGTPIMSRPIELWTLWYWLRPETCPSYWDFAKQYCGADSVNGWDVRGAANLDELRERIAPWMLRRMKSDVLTELPPKIREAVEIEDENGALLRKEREAWGAVSGGARLTDGTFEEVFSRLEPGRPDTSMIAKVRHETALGKVPYVVSHVKDLLEKTDKVLVFAYHRDVIAGIQEGLAGDEYGALAITGETPLAERQRIVDAFQGSGRGPRVLVGQIQAAGVGLTLTAASTVVFAELDWTPAAMTQAEDRAHRIGQKDAVLVQHVVLARSLDAYMARALIRKQQIVAEVLDCPEHAFLA